VIRHRRLAVLASLLITAFLVSWAPLLRFDNSPESFLLADDPEVILYNQFRDDFDRDDRVFLAIHPPRVFSMDFLEKLRALERDLESQVPYVEEVTSLISARSTRGESGELVVGELLGKWPEDAAALDRLRERVLANPLYLDTLISQDARLTIVVIKPFTYSALDAGGELDPLDELQGSPSAASSEPEYLSAPEIAELLAALRAVIARHRAPGFPIHLGGGLAVNDTLNSAMARDVVIFVAVGFAVVSALLYFLFRRLAAVAIPVVVVWLSLLATLGIMVMLGIPGSTSVEILPAFLGTVGVCASVHILAIVYQRLRAGSTREGAIVFALAHSGLPVVMTSLTTAAGMMSFVTAQLAPVTHLGIVAPIGIVLALLYTLVLLPALLAMAPLERRAGSGEVRVASAVNRVLVAAADSSARHPWRILALAALLVAVSAAGAARVRFSHDSLDWLPESDPLRVAFELIDREMKGSVSLEVVVDSGRENGLLEPALLARLEAAARYAESLEVGPIRVGKSLSIVDVLKEIHQALNENRPEHRRLPGDRKLVAQELLLFESSGSDDLEELVDGQFRRARLSLRVPWADAMLYPAFLRELRAGLERILGDEIDFQLTGFLKLISGVLGGMVVSMFRSYGFALLVITPMMMLLLGSLRLGLLSMIPNLIPVLFTLGVMGWLGLPLDASTIMIGAIVIGLAVDDTIHFMHRFQRSFAATGDAQEAIRDTLLTTGAAMLFTTLALCAGFLTFTFATMTNIVRFGVLGAMAIVVALLADLLVGPALMVLVTERSRRTTRRGGAGV
jgi:predicted RND superfamily exporter protein